MGKVKLLLFVVLAAFFGASTGFAAEKCFEANLTSKGQVKKPNSTASGKATFKRSEDGKTMSYRLYASGITDATAVQIHIGRKGVDGPAVIVIPFGGEKKGKVNGLLSEGKITDMDLLGQLQGKPLDELVRHIKAGNVYVNIHSYGNPNGEIRGQIM